MVMSAKRFAPATARNRGPILEVLTGLWTAPGHVLEIASGTGEHAVHFARHLTHLTWQPSDPDPGAIASIEAWRKESKLDNLAAPVVLDVCAQPWPSSPPTGIFCANMIHIAPWSCTLALMDGAQRVLNTGDLLVLYGPFAIEREHTATSNAAFDLDLRQRDPSWGVRDLADVTRAATSAGLAERTRLPMPANNLIVVFERR